jgi:putative nucleotidyltransferase with HDIG domain
MPPDEASREVLWTLDEWFGDVVMSPGTTEQPGTTMQPDVTLQDFQTEGKAQPPNVQSSTTQPPHTQPPHTQPPHTQPPVALRSVDMDPYRGWKENLPSPHHLLRVQTYPPRVVPEAARGLMRLTESLARMLGRRVDETLEHTVRVVELAGRMARMLGFSPDRRDALIWGAHLHDIGKLAVPPEVLHKQGELTPDEWRAMRGHVEAGQAIAQTLDCLPWASMCVLAQHHEHWNGGGYPLGLTGDGISLEARMFAFCDVYDALTHARTYKPAWTRAQAIREIRSLTGSVFDPALLGVFLQVVAELPEDF